MPMLNDAVLRLRQATDEDYTLDCHSAKIGKRLYSIRFELTLHIPRSGSYVVADGSGQEVLAEIKRRIEMVTPRPYYRVSDTREV